MPSRKILLVTNDLGPRVGGIETFILGLLEHLDGSAIVIYTAAQQGSDLFDASARLVDDFQESRRMFHAATIGRGVGGSNNFR